MQVDGVDLDEASIADARRNAAAAGMADRVRFEVADAALLDGAGGYDLACIFEALHDMGDPVGALLRVRGLLGPGAPLLVVDERVVDSFTAAGDEVERRSTTRGACCIACRPPSPSHFGGMSSQTAVGADRAGHDPRHRRGRPA